MKLGPGFSFSWKRALGVTKAKRRVSKKTGSEFTRSATTLQPWLSNLSNSPPLPFAVRHAECLALKKLLPKVCRARS